MRGLVVVALLLACAVTSRHRLTAWHDDLTLWTAAAGVADTPRAAVNLAAAYLVRRHFSEAADWDVRAMALSTGRPDAALVRSLVRAHLTWMLLSGVDRCSVQPWASWCS